MHTVSGNMGDYLKMLKNKRMKDSIMDYERQHNKRFRGDKLPYCIPADDSASWASLVQALQVCTHSCAQGHRAPDDNLACMHGMLAAAHVHAGCILSDRLYTDQHNAP